MLTDKERQELDKLREGGMTFRKMMAQSSTYDSETHSFRVIASTEQPVEIFDWERWDFVDEVLVSDGFELRSGDQVPLLNAHNRFSVEDVLGSARNWIRTDSGVEADVFLSSTEDAADAETKMREGHITDVSVGYRPIVSTYIPAKERQLINGKEYVGPVRVTSKWRVHELSLVPVGADVFAKVRSEHQSGVNREAEINKRIQEEVDKQLTITLSRGNSTMDKTKEELEKEARENEQKALQIEEERKVEINAIASRFVDRVPSAKRYAEDAIKLGVTIEQFRGTIYDRVTDDKPLESTNDIGMNEKEKRSYSILRLLRAVTDPKNKQAQEEAKFEFECSAAAREKKEIVRGVATIPNDVLMHSYRRDLIAGTGTMGGNLVQTTVGGGFIDVLRANMVFAQLGARYLTGLQGNLSIPSQTAATLAYWPGENTAPTEGAPTYGQLALTPKTVAGYVDIGRRLMIQSSIDVESLVRNDLFMGLAHAMEAAAINGTTTSNQYNGIINTSGIGATTGGTNAAAPTWANILEMESDVATANAETGSIAYLTNPAVRGKLKATLKVSTAANSDFIWDSRAGNTPVNGYACAVTSAVPSTLTKGTSTAICSAIIYGNFADCVFGLWGNGIDILVDPNSLSTVGGTRVVAIADVDFGLRHVASISAMLDALTA